MVAEGGIEIVPVDSGDYARASRALGDDSLMRDLLRAIGRGFDDISDEIVDDIQSNILGMQTTGRYQTSPPLRSSVADATHADTELDRDKVTTSIVVDQTPQVRGFRHAARALNSSGGWDHPIYGFGSMHQIGRPGFFDEPIEERLGEIDDIVYDALDDFLGDLARRSS